MARGGLFGFKLNSPGIQSLLDGAQGVDAMLEAEAQDCAGRVRSNAPVVTGNYRDNVRVETVHTDRMVKRVVADVDYAMQVEADHGTLARSL